MSNTPDPTTTKEFWEWLRKRGEQKQQQSHIEAVLELPPASNPKPKLEENEENSKDIWENVDYTIYSL